MNYRIQLLFLLLVFAVVECGSKKQQQKKIDDSSLSFEDSDEDDRRRTKEATKQTDQDTKRSKTTKSKKKTTTTSPSTTTDVLTTVTVTSKASSGTSEVLFSNSNMSTAGVAANKQLPYTPPVNRLTETIQTILRSSTVPPVLSTTLSHAGVAMDGSTSSTLRSVNILTKGGITLRPILETIPTRYFDASPLTNVSSSSTHAVGKSTKTTPITIGTTTDDIISPTLRPTGSNTMPTSSNVSGNPTSVDPVNRVAETIQKILPSATVPTDLTTNFSRAAVGGSTSNTMRPIDHTDIPTKNNAPRSLSPTLGEPVNHNTETMQTILPSATIPTVRSSSSSDSSINVSTSITLRPTDNATIPMNGKDSSESPLGSPESRITDSFQTTLPSVPTVLTDSSFRAAVHDSTSTTMRPMVNEELPTSNNVSKSPSLPSSEPMNQITEINQSTVPTVLTTSSASTTFTTDERSINTLKPFDTSTGGTSTTQLPVGNATTPTSTPLRPIRTTASGTSAIMNNATTPTTSSSLSSSVAENRSTKSRTVLPNVTNFTGSGSMFPHGAVTKTTTTISNASLSGEAALTTTTERNNTTSVTAKSLPDTLGSSSSEESAFTTTPRPKKMTIRKLFELYFG